jgi:DNA repair protein RadC
MTKAKSTRKIKIDSYADDDILISKALRCLEDRMRYAAGDTLNSSLIVSRYLRLQLAQEKNEVFSALFLDNRHRLLAFEKMFYGTINESVVYPRGIIQKALEYNAAAIIAAHNHPSGNLTPSSADMMVTNQLKDILKILDIKLIDHFIITHKETYSFAEKGLL